jgi:hypothetical protein
MPTLRFEAEELDETTLAYLQTVRDRRGKGCPGVFLDQKECGLWGDWKLLWGMLGGLLFLVIVLGCTVGSAGSPVASAMLQTAGIVLGGWLALAYVRALVWRNRPDYLGYFKFLDGGYLWFASGRGVWVTPLDRVREATYHDNRDQNGNYTYTNVRIKLKQETADLPVYSAKKASRVVVFLNLQHFLRSVPVGERGYATKYILDQHDPDDLCDGDDDDLEHAAREVLREQDVIVDAGVVEGAPEPRKVRTVTGWWRYPLILGVGVAVFLVAYQIDRRTRDDLLWGEVKNDRPPLLRGYLADRRNTRHRTEAFRKLEAFHEQAAAGILNRPGGKQELKEGLALVARGLARQVNPVVTIGFKELPPPEGQPKVPLPGAAWDQPNRQRDAIRDISIHLSQKLSDELAGYAAAPEGETPMIEIGYVLKRGEGVPLYRVDWTITFRGKEGDKPVVYQCATQTQGGFNPGDDLRRLYEGIVNEVKAGVP